MQKGCLNTNTACKDYIPGKCVYYSGNALACSGVNYNDTIDTALKKLDTKICSISTDLITAAAGNKFIQLLIGDPSSIMSEGDQQFIIYDPLIAFDSVWVTKDGGELPRGEFTDRLAYNVSYSLGVTTITFNQPVYNGGLYIVHYMYNEVSSYNVDFNKIQFKVGQPGSLITAGSTTLTINDSLIIADTLSVMVDGEILPDNTDGLYDSDYNYVPVFSTLNTILTFSNAAANDQVYIISYVKVSPVHVS